MPKYFSGLIKILVAGLFISVVVYSIKFFNKTGQVTSFEKEASTIVSNNGGIRADNNDDIAITDKLVQLSKNYNGNFKVNVDETAPNVHQSFGKHLRFTVHTDIKYLNSLSIVKDRVVDTTSKYGS